MYAFMYAFMYVCMYVCMYVSCETGEATLECGIVSDNESQYLCSQEFGTSLAACRIMILRTA